MPSTVPSYEYDIFISYRQNDNRSGWVTEFVKHLNEELAATIKEPVSLYFDSNPHDGLLETHHVNKSLEGKLKCLIFIPILSQTYCDSNSFAWQHEFCAFNKMSSNDQFGRNIKLSNGNVASRILPVKIHDLDEEDLTTFEKETGDILRAIDFIFKSPGVNRPLRFNEDHVNDNLNKTFYPDQINKVANAVKELIVSLKNPQAKSPALHRPLPAQPHLSLRKSLIPVAFLVFAAVAYVASRTLYADDEQVVDKSVAVLPFTNLSNDPEQDYFSDGITEQVISSLARLKDIKVIARTSVLQYKNTTKSIAQIGKELNVAYVLESSVRKAGNQMRITAQLISVRDESHLWSQDFDDQLTSDVIKIQDAVASKIAISLKKELQPEEKARLKTEQPSTPEAYEHYVRGVYAEGIFNQKFNKDDLQRTEIEYKQAIELDSSYATAKAALANLYDTYANVTNNTKEKTYYRSLCTELAVQAYRLNPTLPYVLAVRFESLRENPDSAYKYGKLALAAAPNGAFVNTEFGMWYWTIGLFEQAVPLIEHAEKIAPGPWRDACLGAVNFEILNYDLAEKYLNRSLKQDSVLFYANLFLFYVKCTQGKLDDANKLLARMKSNTARDFAWEEAQYLAFRGDQEKALARSKDVRIYAILKMKKETLAGLEKVPFDYLRLKAHYFDFLREDVRFKEIVTAAKHRYDEMVIKYGNIDLPKD